jgi:hypothetical protein
VLHVHFPVDVNELPQRPIVVDHVERADETQTLRLRENRLILALTDGRKEPPKILDRMKELRVLLHHPRERHGSRQHRQVALKQGALDMA